MKKRIFTALCCLCAWTVQAAGSEWLARLQQAVQTLGAYEVLFDVATSDGYATSGSYRVEGERYRMELPGMCVCGDAAVRYEVNEEAREVVVDAVDRQSNNLLDNPVHAFDFVGERYAVEVAGETAERITLRLTPRETGSLATIELTVAKSTALPLAVVYGTEGVQITVKINAFRKSSTALPVFRRNDFPDYEWIDFR